MAATSFPEHPRFYTISEREVWAKVVRQLPDGSIVLPNLRISDEQHDHEADLVLLIPDAGIIVVEVKGSHVWHDGQSWLIRRDEATAAIHPVDQARNTAYALRRYVQNDPRWLGAPVQWAWHVVLAHTELHPDFSTPDCPRWAISGANDLDQIGQRLLDSIELHRINAASPTTEQVALIHEILTGRWLPPHSPSAEAADREMVAERLTAEQASLLSVTRLLNRVEVRGGAGSGKTVMAMRQASDLAQGRYGPKKRVAVLCYSYGLGAYLERCLKVGPRSKQPSFVGTFEDFAITLGVEITATRSDSQWWEKQLPQLMAEKAEVLPSCEKYDAIIVDEAQDFAQEWWNPLLASLRDPEIGGLYIYSDERQRIFPRFGTPPVSLVPLVLDHNLRNTRQIGEVFSPLAPYAMQLRGGDGPEVTFIPSDPADAIETSDEWVEQLLDEGWQPGDIALLTFATRHPVQVERQETVGQRDYWQEYWNDEVFYGHVLGFKGLERRAVVLCVNIDKHYDHAAERLYVGLSRATDRLVVVGDPATITQIGGMDVARRLGLA